MTNNEQKLIVQGGRRLEGEIAVQGAKNSVLALLAATTLCNGTAVLHNCPKLTDADAAFRILDCLGCRCKREMSVVSVDAERMCNNQVPDCLMQEMRSSIVFLGAILGRCGNCRWYTPGGCDLGARPIDYHLEAFRQMGVEVENDAGFMNCTAPKGIKGAKIALPFPSVGATENIMLAGVTAKGTTEIHNAAKEPEIVDLIGANVNGAGTNEIIIHGTKKLNPVKHCAIADRIVASTYLCATAATGGKIVLVNVIPEDLNAVLEILRDMGCTIEIHKNSLTLKAPQSLNSVDFIRTMPHPGFPTDAQAIVMSTLTVAEGTSIISENIFDNRYKHAEMLCRMGADIKIDGRIAVVRGIGKEGILGRLTGCKVEGKDLRGTAALIIAALNAKGTAEVSGLEYFERGYVGFEENIKKLGGDIALFC
jgi:UDP-N-acetylglucosamine 1-carboxyvinyltransferase